MLFVEVVTFSPFNTETELGMEDKVELVLGDLWREGEKGFKTEDCFTLTSQGLRGQEMVGVGLEGAGLAFGVSPGLGMVGPELGVP